ncbi:hemerythrin domain-containing protein [Aggregicoccus sp. 17bor-14]|uniref:hemerythrin domain-containing protein n=1 Tax=Myxococcaceae TaxID=31 RepID=UPI00129C3E73|nr:MULTISPECIES: hemerythrin domain-containing protein [Myxococcaceae]MBF5045389.1 hemerythrin domain-containing protein [Simulacricoccus sp. 17bor-14]MRI91130.1 hemerythrin domain-containing protein [Aggregicoccus sp. 17bor-14]
MGPFDYLAEMHRDLEERFEAVESADPDDVQPLTAELVEALRLHSRLEERHLYPLIGRVQGRARARQGVEDHLTLRELMAEMEDLRPSSFEWLARLLALKDVVMAHVQEEEAQDFPRLQAALEPHEQEELQRSLERTHVELLRDMHGMPAPVGAMPILEPLRWDA